MCSGIRLHAISAGQHTVASFEEFSSGGKPLATLCSSWPARDFNLKPPATEMNTLSLDRLHGVKLITKANNFNQTKIAISQLQFKLFGRWKSRVVISIIGRRSGTPKKLNKKKCRPVSWTGKNLPIGSCFDLYLNFNSVVSQRRSYGSWLKEVKLLLLTKFLNKINPNMPSFKPVLNFTNNGHWRVI